MWYWELKEWFKNYREDEKQLHNLKKEIKAHTNQALTFIEIYALDIEGKRVVMFQTPVHLPAEMLRSILVRQLEMITLIRFLLPACMDEASQVRAMDAFLNLECSNRDTRFLLVGDDDQLPPICVDLEK